MDGLVTWLWLRTSSLISPIVRFLRRNISRGGPGSSRIRIRPGHEAEAARLFRPAGPLVGLTASGQATSGHGADLTLLLVEERAHEFRVHILLSLADAASRLGWFPTITLEASDDLGGSYHALSGGGNGYHGESWMIGRLDPAVALDATRLYIQVTAIQWHNMRDPRKDEVQPGPWLFSVSRRPSGTGGPTGVV